MRGAFDEESIVEVRATDGTVIGRGMVLCSADSIRSIKGKRTADLPAEMAHEVVHRDDLQRRPMERPSERAQHQRIVIQEQDLRDGGGGGDS